MNQNNFSREFKGSSRPHILMITNHGVHDWTIRGGLTDTGGQNHYVLALSDTLVSLGFKVTTYNRGGYKDPLTEESRTGSQYKDACSRIVYLEGGGNKFIRKEDIDRSVLLEESKFAKKIIAEEKLPIDLIISHYWDGALLAAMIKDSDRLNCKHVWIPHSLGALKMENFRDKPPEIVASLRFDERIAYEKEVLQKVDAVASTSADISKTLINYYAYEAQLFLPPCINTNAIHPMEGGDFQKIYDFLSETDPKTGKKARGNRCILEMSRTDHTKRKDVLVRAFAELLKDHPETMLLLRINPKSTEVYNEIISIIDELEIRENVVLVGMVPEEIKPQIFAISDLYVSTSEMEGFGMSVQEACASKKATISSDLIPFAVQFLLKDVREESLETDAGWCTIKWGAGGIVVPAGKVEGFARAMKRVFDDDYLRESIAKKAYEITIPYFTWDNMTKTLLEQMKIQIPV